MADSANFASDSVCKKKLAEKRESGARSSVRCWKCSRKGHKLFENPHRKKKKKNRCEDAYNDRKKKLNKLRVCVKDSEMSDSDGSASD